MSWGTAGEIEFLEKLGSYQNELQHKKNRLELLLKYKEAMPNRSNWKLIARKDLEAALDRMIEEETRRSEIMRVVK